ncbi:MAG: PEP-CTERM sorting domain-containing protein [Aquabacterium sp.]|nr:MAG: PEP-CTERM sorting domain-containing protein [Aquabacterium sp.]
MRAFIIAAAAAAFIAPAFAATETIGTGTTPWRLENTAGSFSLSNDVLAAFSLVGIYAEAVAPATYLRPTISTTISSVSYDSGSGLFTAGQSVAGATLKLDDVTEVGGTGWITLSGLTIDPLARLVYADVSGANGLQPQRVDLFRYATASGDTSFSGAGDYTITALALTPTENGIRALETGLGLNSLGDYALRRATNFGSMKASFTVVAVPEPSTWALLGLGLACAAGVARRRVAVKD